MGRKNGWKLDGSKIVQKFFKNDIDWIFFFNSWIERLVQKPPEFNQKRAEIGGNFDDGRMKYAQN